MSTIVYGIPLSPFVRKTLLALEHANVTHKVNPVLPGDKSEEFKACSPLGKIPAFQNDEVKLSDSSVICAYLAKKHPEANLYPTDPVQLAKNLWIEEYADSELIKAYGPLILNKFIRPFVSKEPVNEDEIENAVSNLYPNCFAYLEMQVPVADFFNGSTPGVADFAIISLIGPFLGLGYAIDPSYEKLNAYIQNLLAVEVVNKRLRSEKAISEQFR